MLRSGCRRSGSEKALKKSWVSPCGKRASRRMVAAALGSVLLFGGAAVLPSGASAQSDVPGEPRNVSVVAGGSGELDVSWDDPASTGNSRLSGFKVQWKCDSQDYDTARQAVLSGIYYQVPAFSALGRSYTIRGLTNGAACTVRVVATSQNGDGTPSAEVAATPVDPHPPWLLGAVVEEAALKLFYNETLDGDSKPPTSAFSVMVDGSSATVNEVSINSRVVTLSLQTAPGALQRVTAGYTPPVTGPIQDTSANDAASFSERHAPHQISGICDRTSLVRTRILDKISDLSECADVRVEHLMGVRGILGMGTSELAVLKQQDFRHLTNLHELELSFNVSLTSLPDGVFDGLSSLRNLYFTKASLDSVPAGVFDELTDLRRLKLDYNDLTQLPQGVFDQLTSLEYLNLSFNEVASLHGGAFDSLAELGTLVLSGNELNSLPSGIFDNLDSLDKLVLYENELSSLDSNEFAALSELTHLELHTNNLSALPSGLLAKVSGLKALTLSKNNLSTLPDGLFSGVTNLRDLWLKDNPGAPFTFTAELEEQTSSIIVVKIAQGAPFDVDVTLSAAGGTVLPNNVTVAAGSTTSQPITVTPATPGQTVTVSVDSAAFGGQYTTTYTSGTQTGKGPDLVMTQPQSQIGGL